MVQPVTQGRRDNGHTMRPCHRSPKAASSRQGAMQQARDRDMDRHAMQSEVGYLFSGLWKGRRAERGGEREIEWFMEGLKSERFRGL